MLKKNLLPPHKKNRYKVLTAADKPLSAVTRPTPHYYKGYAAGASVSAHNSPSPTPQLYPAKSTTPTQPRPADFHQKYRHLKTTSTGGGYAFPTTAAKSTIGAPSAYDQFYKSQEPREELEEAAFSYKKRAFHKKSASTLSPEVQNMLGKYVTSVGHNLVVASGNNTPNTSIHQHHQHQHTQPQPEKKPSGYGYSRPEPYLMQTPEKPSSYIVQIHQHQHQHQYHYHLSSSTNPSRPDSSKLKQPTHASMLDSHQLKTQLEKSSVTQSQVFEPGKKAGGSSGVGGTGGLHMRTKSDHLLQNLPVKSTMKNNYVKAKTGGGGQTKYAQTAFKKKPGFPAHGKTNSEVPQLPLSGLGGKFETESTFQTPKLSQQSTIYQPAPQNQTPSNSQRHVQRKTSLHLQKKGGASSTTTAYPLSTNATPNFKSSVGKKRVSVQSTASPGLGSHHVTPKSKGNAGVFLMDQQPPVYHHGHHMSMIPAGIEAKKMSGQGYSHKRSTSEGVNEMFLLNAAAQGPYPAAPISGSNHGLRMIKRASVATKHQTSTSEVEQMAASHLRMKGAQSTEPTLECKDFRSDLKKRMLSDSNLSLHSHLSNSVSQQNQASPRQLKYSFYIGAPDDKLVPKPRIDAQSGNMSNAKNIRSTPISSLNSLEMAQSMQQSGRAEPDPIKYPSRPGSSYSKIPPNDGDQPRIPSVRQAYGLPAGKVQKISGVGGGGDKEPEQPESGRLFTIKPPTKYKPPPPDTGAVKSSQASGVAGYMRRKSQSISSQKQILSSQQLRKNSTNQSTNLQKYQQPVAASKKKLLQSKPKQSKPLTQKVSARGQPSPKGSFISKIPAPLAKKQAVAVEDQQQHHLKFDSVITPIDLTPGPLMMGQAGETIENLLPRQETTASAVELSPRSKNRHKLTRYIRAYFERFSEAPQTTADFYRIGKMLGRGAFGKVNLALHKLTNELVAVKSMNKTMLENERSKRKVMQEITILKRIRHPHIVNLFETFETKKHILFVMELCAGGDLLNYVRKRRRLKEPLAKFVFLQIVSGLHYCHLNRILHRDIKLDNILLDAFGHVKICDFGVSKIVKRGQRIKDQCGTPAYIAPEILLDKGYEGFTVDIWSAGVVLYAMLYGTVPFKANNMSELHKLIIAADYTLKDDISEQARDLLKHILEPEPARRFTMNEILEHPWMKDVDNTLCLFTESEKQIIRSEFTYNDCRRYNRNENSDIFTQHQLDTEANELERNASEKSIILAPFNSTKSHISMDPHSSIQDLVRTRQAIRFGAKVREINRQYEQNNNQELDNGVYNKFVCEEREQELLSPQGSFNSPRSISPRELTPRKEIEKLEQEGLENLERLKEIEMEARKQEGIYKIVTQEQIDDEIVDEVVLNGYPRDYIMKCLKAKDANHATTTYYLLQTLKAGFAFNNFKEEGLGLGLGLGRLQQSLKIIDQ